MIIAITGVTGFIGRRLATIALEDGHQVIGFSRRPWLGDPQIPLEDRHFLELPVAPAPSVLAGVDAVIHLAVAAPTADARVTDAVNHLGTERLFDAARRARINRFIFVSSQSAHAASTSAYGQSKHLAEQALADEDGVVVVRPGMVYGEADDGLMGRAVSTAAKLRVFPVIGGRQARVQPIHVDELCRALLVLASMTDPPGLVLLADPEVHPLGEVIREQAKRYFGVRPLGVPVPIGLARLGIRLASRLHLPSPISEDNLDGIETFAPMDTGADIARFGFRSPSSPAGASVVRQEPRRVIVVGAGRIGLVHALTAVHHQRMVLVGVVDLNHKATGQLIALGNLAVPAFSDLDQALKALQPDAAIVATPPSSHVPLATKLLAAGVDVLVEKPLAPSAKDRLAFASAMAAHPERYVGTGYLAGLLPHIDAVLADLVAGRFGVPLSFDAHAFVSRVEKGVAEKREMWELDPEISGGGALINLGVHVLTMLDVLLGPVTVDDAVLVVSDGRATEDGASMRLRAGNVTGRFSLAWHLPGFDMPENSLRIDTDRGFVLCTTSCAAFVADNELRVVHQVDADHGFDLAPMDAGGAFWVEQDLLARRLQGRNSFDVANRVEELISRVYQSAARIAPPALGPESALPILLGEPTPGVLPDLRGAPELVQRQWSGPALIGSSRAAKTLLSDEAIVVLPDAPAHFRTLTNDGPAALVRSLGVGRIGLAATGVSALRAASSQGRPWEALLVLLRAELRRLPRSFPGTVIVDAYLVDLATATGNMAAIGAALDDLRHYCPKARVGIEVNAVSRLVPLIPAIAGHLDVIVALGTTVAGGLDPLRSALPPSTDLIVKTGVLPVELLEIAWKEPDRWTLGRSPLVVHWPGTPGLGGIYEAALTSAKQAAGFSEE